MENKLKIAVIGAGLAGLSCASHLQTAGHQITVFDKSRGPGGRLATRRGDDWQCDHGAQYFTASDPAFQAELARWTAAGVAAPWAARLSVLGEGRGAAPESALRRYVGTPRMTAPARFLAESLHLVLATTIVEICPTAQGWQLVSQEQGRLASTFDRVVVAVPAPQAVPLLQAIAPALAARAAAADMQPTWSLMLRYEQPLDLPFDAAFVNQGALRWIARDNSKPGRGPKETWLLHADTAWSAAHLEASADSVGAALLSAFAELGGRPPEAWTAHRWRYADATAPGNAAEGWLAAAGIGLCGDWLAGGKIEGAWLSGRALANHIQGAQA